MHAAEDYKLSKQKILDVIYLFQKKKDNKKLIFYLIAHVESVK